MGEVIDIAGRGEREEEPPELDALARRVIAVVAHQTGRHAENVGLDTLIERDLGCTGDDAMMLMGRMAGEFGVDMRGFDFDRHFGNEGGLGWPVAVALVVAVPLTILGSHAFGLVSRLTGWSPLGALTPTTQFGICYAACALLILGAMTLLPQARLRRSGKVPLTIQDLVDAARTRRWMLNVTKSGLP